MIRETELISLKDGKTKSLTEFVQDLAPTPEPMNLTPSTPVDTGGADPVALSSYIDGIADTSASDAITAGLASGGSIANAIDNVKSHFVHDRITSSKSYTKSDVDQYDLLYIFSEQAPHAGADKVYLPGVCVPTADLSDIKGIFCEVYRDSNNVVNSPDGLKLVYWSSGVMSIVKPADVTAIHVMLIKF